MLLADAHAHFFRTGYHGDGMVLWPNNGELAAYEQFRVLHRIETTLAIGYEGNARYSGNNAYLGKIAQARSWLRPLAYCSIDVPPSLQKVNAWKAEGFIGVSLYVNNASASASLNRWPASLWSGLSEWGNRGALVSINATARILPKLFRGWTQVPDLPILISHLGLPGRLDSAENVDRGLLEQVCVLARFSRVHIKASGFYACGPFPHEGAQKAFRVLQEAFGAERLLWGSDFAPALHAVSFAQTIAVLDPLSRRERRLIGGENLLRLIHS